MSTYVYGVESVSRRVRDVTLFRLRDPTIAVLVLKDSAIELLD